MNSKILLTSDRLFQLWTYTVSHKSLLLRSTKCDEHDSRIDLLFKPVSWMSVVTVLRGLEIREVDSSEVALKMGGAALLPSDKIYEISSQQTVGYVAAGAFAMHQDEGEYYTESALLPRFVAISR